MPQRGYGLQPRVAASATLGKESDLVLNRNAVASAVHFFLRKRRNRVAVEISFPTSSQGSRSGNPGLEAVAPLGHQDELPPHLNLDWLRIVRVISFRPV